jgi:tight adherence protein B
MLLAIVVFVGVFGIAAFLIAATGVNASEQAKKALARLEVLLAASSENQDEQVDIQKRELLSSIPFVNRILLRLEVAPHLRLLLYQANVKWSPGGLLLMSGAAWVVPAYLLYLQTGAIWFSVVLALVPAAIPYGYVRWKRSRRLLKFEEMLPAALDLMVSGLRSGQGFVTALSLVGREMPDPVGPEYRICFDEQNYGLELRTAFENLCTRVPLQDNRIVMTAILIHKETGGNLAEVLEKCANVIRERFRLQREIRTKTAQGRLSGLVLALLPVVLATGMYLAAPEVISLLWTRPAGLKMLDTGIVMLVVGSLLIRKIVNVRV